LSRCLGTRKTVKARYFPPIYTHFSGFGLDLHKMLVTQALSGTICHLLGAVGGTIKLRKLCKISEQKYLLSESSKQSKKIFVAHHWMPNPGRIKKSYLKQTAESKHLECLLLRLHELILWKCADKKKWSKKCCIYHNSLNHAMFWRKLFCREKPHRASLQRKLNL